MGGAPRERSPRDLLTPEEAGSKRKKGREGDIPEAEHMNDDIWIVCGKEDSG